MLTEKPLYSVLVVSSSAKSRESVLSMLPASMYKPVVCASSAGEAKRMMLSACYDIVVVDAPLPDQFGYELACDTAQDTQAGIMLLVRNDIFEHAAQKVERFGVLTVAKPVTKQLFYQMVKLLTATRARLEKLEKKNMSLRDTVEEIRMVNRAKWALIERMDMTEAQAHRYIEKQAMDRRISRRELAQEIINLHES
ncbi:MAG: ANTAR domain-containing protein [Clostridiales bacterium]|nr:ANTAR domain-containing protein [Clostridiales bacterium]